MLEVLRHACRASRRFIAASRHMRWDYSVSFNFIFRKQVAPTVPVVRSRVPPSALTDRTPPSASAAIQSAFKVGASGRSGAVRHRLVARSAAWHTFRLRPGEE